MPTYDYRCKACGHAFELFQSMSDAAKRRCPSCGKNSLERLIGTGAAVLFKGSGFYQTDYRSAEYKKAASAETSSSATSKDTSSPGAAKDTTSPRAKTGEPKPAQHKTVKKPREKKGD